jgi:signal transduction histidine kinase
MTAMTAELVLERPNDDLMKWWGGVMDALPFYVLLVDEDHRIVAWNQATQKDFKTIRPLGAYCPEAIHGQCHAFEGCPLDEAVCADSAIEKQLFDSATGRWVSSAVFPTSLRTSNLRRIYLHFTRDITSEKVAQLALAQSLEHHKALGLLLRRLGGCKQPVETLQQLIDTTLELSWMLGTCGAAAFLAKGEELELVYSRDLGSQVEDRCARVAFGHCLCGRVASERKPILPGDPDSAHLHVVPDRNHDHGHAAFPLLHEGMTLGVINFYVKAGTKLEPSQREFLDAATTVTTAALSEQLSRAAAHEAELKTAALEHKLLELVIMSQEEERKRVARELHDDLGQALSALLLDIKTMAQDNGKSCTEICTRMDHGVRDLVSRVSTLAWDLRPAVLDDLGLDSALSRHVSNVAQRAKLTIDYRFMCPPELEPRLPNSMEIALYRILQEALNNVVKYAMASRVSVLVYRRSESVVLVVEDDGNGFDVTAVDQTSDGLGLIGMRERANLLKGDLVIESAPGEGTMVKVTLPILAQAS